MEMRRRYLKKGMFLTAGSLNNVSSEVNNLIIKELLLTTVGNKKVQS
jgi:hypothetical protein